MMGKVSKIWNSNYTLTKTEGLHEACVISALTYGSEW